MLVNFQNQRPRNVFVKTALMSVFGTLDCDDKYLLKLALYPLSYGPACWSHRDSNPDPRHLSDVVPTAFVAN